MMWNNKHLALAAAAGTAVVAGVIISPNARDSMRGGGADLMTMLGARSPGVRSEGAMTTKGLRVAASAPRAARALPVASGPRQAAIIPAAPVAGGLAPVAIASPAPFAPIAPAVARTPVLAAAPVFAAGGGGLGAAALLPIPLVAAIASGGGGGGGGGPTPSTTPAIPEPGTWLMMIVGFGMLGMFLRRRRRIEAGQGGAAGKRATSAAVA